MKKILLSFLLLSLVFIVQAQDAKPTKEQTIAYLKNVLLNPNGVEWTTSSAKLTCGENVLSISFSGCSFIIETNMWCSNDEGKANRNTVYTIDISKIEKIDAEGFKAEIVRLTAQNHALVIQKKYTYTNESGEQTMKISSERDVSFPCPVEKEKVMKAFNHLRKLCSAPEPITF